MKQNKSASAIIFIVDLATLHGSVERLKKCQEAIWKETVVKKPSPDKEHVIFSSGRLTDRPKQNEWTCFHSQVENLDELS